MTVTKVQTRTIKTPGYRTIHNGYGYVTVDRWTLLPQSYRVEVSSTRGENLGDWKAIIGRGDNATTSLSGYDKVQKAAVTGYAQLAYPPEPTRKDLWMKEEGVFLNYNSLPGILAWQTDAALKKAERAAYEGFVSRCLGHLESVNGLQFVGELRDTIRLIVNPLGAITNLANRLRKKGLTNAIQSSAEALAELRLQWAFGVKPLISDLDGGLQALAKIKLHGGRNYRMVKNWSETGSSGNTSGTYGFHKYYVTNTSSAKATVRGVIDLPTLENNGGGFAYDILGLNKNNIPRTAWELIPFSFLADYFLSIGETLDAITLISSGSLRWHSLTTRFSRVTEMKSQLHNPNGLRVDFFSPAKCIIEESNVVRHREQPSMELVYYPSDTVGEALTSANKVANMTALATLSLGKALRSK